MQNLNATRLIDSPSREAGQDGQNSQKVDETSPENLRNFVRESRMFLSKHGYKNPISLIEGIAADFDADLASFRDKSSALANIRELSDVDEALLEGYSRLTTSLKHVHEVRENLKVLRTRLTGELETLQRNNASLTAIDREISNRRDSFNMDQSLLRNETANDEALRAKVTYLENELHKRDALSLQTNKSMAEAAARVQSSLRDVAVHESALSELREAVNATELATVMLKTDARDAEKLVREAYEGASSLHNETEVFGQDADDMQRLYMEKMADVSELTRRLNDLVRSIADAESSRERILREILSQKKQIQASLSHRESLTEALEVEVRVHNNFVDKKGDIQGSLDQRACTT
jgi:chromosome segregation ATPase